MFWIVSSNFFYYTKIPDTSLGGWTASSSSEAFVFLLPKLLPQAQQSSCAVSFRNLPFWRIKRTL